MLSSHQEVSAANGSLVCIGESIRLSGADLHLVADLFLSPSGAVFVAVHKSTGDANAIAMFISGIGFSGLDMIAADYFFKTEGQAAGIVDIMARYGHISFSEAEALRESVSLGASSPTILFLGEAAK